jgi:hypothetical protein
VLLNVRLFLQWLGDGSLIRNVTAGGLGLMAILATFGCIGIWISSLTLFGDAEGIIGILGVLLWLIFFPYAAYLSIGAILVRANEIRNLSASEYSISPILNILLGLQGEVVFILAIVGSVPLTLMTWAFYAQMAGAFDLPATDGFLIGIMVLLGTLGIGYGAYLLSRFMQEFLFVLPSIARNVDLMRKQKSDQQKRIADAALMNKPHTRLGECGGSRPCLTSSGEIARHPASSCSLGARPRVLHALSPRLEILPWLRDPATGRSGPHRQPAGRSLGLCILPGPVLVPRFTTGP